MALRKDGIKTRKRILQAACCVFAEKGYRDATVAGICKRARANQAAINYHFRDKNSLYGAVWKHSAEAEAVLYPFDAGVDGNSPAEDRFQAIVGALVRRVGDQGKLGYFQKLKVMETANPTGIITDVVREFREPFRDRLKAIIREILGVDTPECDILRCERSVVGQCLIVKDAMGPLFSKEPVKPLTTQELNVWIQHITDFSLAGIHALRKANTEKKKRSRSVKSVPSGKGRKMS